VEFLAHRVYMLIRRHVNKLLYYYMERYRSSVLVQSTASIDSSPKWSTVCQMHVKHAHSLTHYRVI